jgi:poly(3-hydroxybutyrate) depolymerase
MLIAVAALWCAGAAGAAAQALQAGTVIERVECADDPAQSYALYLPKAYSPGRKWSLLLAFHPGARGPLMVEKFKTAAEHYGYIVAASNNSRNGPYAVSGAAAQAMSTDVSRRFSVDPQRLYLAGMSGGARVALGIALGGNIVAGVIASSAGYPDSRPRASVPFAVFGTAGTEDFNYLEMRLLDRKLSSPHLLAVFPGGHTLPPDDVAYDALEWMELQAMQSGRRGRDDTLVARIAEKRRARIAASTEVTETVYLLRALVADFKGLADVSGEAARLDEMTRRSDVKKALARDRDADDAEGRMLGEVFDLEAQLGDGDRREVAVMMLRERLTKLRRKADAEIDTPDRSQARRVLRSITAGASGRVQDREYLTLLERYRLQGR